MPTKKPRCPNGSRRKPRKTGKCIKTKKKSSSKSPPKRRYNLKVKKDVKSSSKTKKKGNYRSFIGCEMKRLKKQNPNMRQASIMKMAAKKWNKGK